MLVENLGYIAAIVGVPIIVVYMKSLKGSKKKNNLTSYFIKLKKQEEVMNKSIKSKGIFS